MTNKTSKELAGKIVTGKVVALSSTKTIVVAIETFHRHPIYRKAVRKTRKYLVHNDGEAPAVGTVVRIQEVRPISKRKHYQIVT